MTALLILSLQSARGQQFASSDTLSSRYTAYSAYLSPEKLYLHMDRTYFTAGESMWFKGYLQNASPLAMLPESNYIYVELKDGKGNLVDRVKIKREGKGFPGCIELPEDIKTGNYMLRAYTLWQLNNLPEYMFHQEVKILGPDGAQNRKPKGSADVLDVSFYPEGGRFFTNTAATIGFKVMDMSGRSVELEATVVDSKGRFITDAVTEHDGMGRILLYAQKGESYFLESSAGGRWPLPQPSVEGASISLKPRGEKMFLCVDGVAGGQYSLLLRDATALRHVSDVLTTGKTNLLRIGSDKIGPGINHFLLVDAGGRIVSERLYFSYPDSTSQMRCSLEPVAFSGAPRDLVQAEISLTGEDAADADCSVSVVRASLAADVQNDDIVSFMSLSSELKGTINDPAWYFREDVPVAERRTGMDLLMLIQGWRYYDLDELLKTDGGNLKISRGKEYMQAVSGRIDRLMSGKAPKKFIFYTMIPSLKYTNMLEVEEGRTFMMDSLDFHENTGFVIKIARQGAGFAYIPKWNGDTFAPDFAYKGAPGHAAEKSDTVSIPLSLETELADTLEAAVVTASVEDGLGDLMFGRSVPSSDLDFFKDRTLMEYLNLRAFDFKYDGQNMINTRSFTGSLRTYESSEESGAEVYDGGVVEDSRVVKLVVDGMEEDWVMFESVFLENIASISISNLPDAFYRAPGGVVSIKIKAGTSIERKLETEPSLLYFVPLGYQVPRYFYSPRYDRGDTSDTPDHRNTVYWNPSVNISNGRADISFCDTDQHDYPYMVRIEGLTSSGKPFSTHTILVPEQ